MKGYIPWLAALTAVIALAIVSLISFSKSASSQRQVQPAMAMVPTPKATVHAMPWDTLGTPFPEESPPLFQGLLRIQGFEHGIAVTHADGPTTLIPLTLESGFDPAIGYLLTAYNARGAAGLYGKAIDGEHQIFNDAFRLHVFEKGVLVYRCGSHNATTGVEGVIFRSSFETPKADTQTP